MKEANIKNTIERTSINRCVKRLLKTNKLRNIFIIVLTALLTFIATSVSSLVMSYNKNYNIMVDRQAGTTASLKLENANDITLAKISSNEFVKNIGIENIFGYVQYDGDNTVYKNADKNKADNKKNMPPKNISAKIILKNIDQTEYKKHKKPAITKIHGFYPSKENEIAVSKNALRMLGLNGSKTGDYINLIIQDKNGHMQSKAFKISMVYTDNIEYTHTTEILVSDQYLYKNHENVSHNANISFSKDKSKRNEYSEDVIKNTTVNDDEKFVKLINTGIDIKAARYFSFILASIIILLLMLLGFIILYNMFDIYIKQDIEFFSKFKLYGASGEQTSRLVKKTAARLAMYGIPIGIITAIVLSGVLVPIWMYLLNRKNLNPAYSVSFNPISIILPGILVYITAMLSVIIPAGKAARYPISRGIDVNNKNKMIFYKDNASKSALDNIFSDKLNFVYIIFPIIISIVSFIVINTTFNTDKTISLLFSSKLLFINRIDVLNKNMVQMIIKILSIGVSGVLYITGIMNYLNEIVSRYNNKYYIYKNIKNDDEKKKFQQAFLFEGIYYATFISIASTVFVFLYMLILKLMHLTNIKTYLYLLITAGLIFITVVCCVLIPLILYEMFAKRRNVN